MPTLYNPGKKKGIFFIPSGATKSPITPVPSFSNTKSLDFDGIDDNVETTSSISGDITLSYWVNCNGTYTAWQPRFPASIAPSNSSAPNETLGRLWKLGVNLWVSLQMYDENGANYSSYTARGVILEGGGWKNLVWTFDNTTKHIYLYINGVAQTWTHYGGVITTPYLTAPSTRLYNSDLKMGTNVGTYYFDGLVDEVSTFDSIKAIGDIWDGSGQPTDLTGQSGLVAWYRMGENSTFSSQILMPENTNKDKFSNYSMDFDGINDYVDCNTGNMGNVDLSISYWIKTSVTGSWVPMWSFCMSAGGHGNGSFGRLYFVGADLKVASTSSYGSTTLNDGNWHHIVETFTASTKVKNTYVDGNTTPEATSTFPAWWNLPTYQFGQVVIGKSTLATTTYLYEGLLDEAAVFDYVLSTGNITALYNGGVPNDLTSLSPISWYRMGEEATFGATWNIPDQIGSSDGTSANMTIEDRVGDAPDSSNNSLSYNMDAADIVEDTPPN